MWSLGRVDNRRRADRHDVPLAALCAHTHPAGMVVVTEAEAAAIRAVYEQRGEFSAAIAILARADEVVE